MFVGIAKKAASLDRGAVSALSKPGEESASESTKEEDYVCVPADLGVIMSDSFMEVIDESTMDPVDASADNNEEDDNIGGEFDAVISSSGSTSLTKLQPSSKWMKYAAAAAVASLAILQLVLNSRQRRLEQPTFFVYAY